MTDAQLDRARQMHKAGELQNAERGYRAILESEPSHPQALHLLGVIALQCGRSEEAIDLLTQATQAKPDFTQALNNLGSALNAAGQHSQASAVYSEAISSDPDFVDAHFNLGVSLQSAEKFEPALEAFEQALALDAEFVDAMVNRGATLKSLGRLEESANAFREVIELEPNHPLAHLNLGLTLLDMKAPDAAIEAFRKATEVTPERTDTYIYLARTLLSQGREKDAIGPLERAAELDPDDAKVQYDLAKVLLDVGDPRAPDARLNLGIALLKSGETESALGAFDANLGLESGLCTPELAMKVMTLKEMSKHQEMEELLGYEEFLRAAIIECPAEFTSLEAFNEALATHVRTQAEDLNDSGGPIAVLEHIVTSAVTAVQNSLPADSSHPFVTTAPGETRVVLRRLTLSSVADCNPRFCPDAWVAGVYFVELAGNPTPDQGPEIEFGCPDPHLKEWMKIRGLRCSAGKIIMFPAFWFHRPPTPDLGGETLVIAIEVLPIA